MASGSEGACEGEYFSWINCLLTDHPVVDGNIYVWNKDHGILIEILRGHSSTVNSIASWRHLIASASDDGTVRIWGPRGDQ